MNSNDVMWFAALLKLTFRYKDVKDNKLTYIASITEKQDKTSKSKRPFEPKKKKTFVIDHSLGTPTFYCAIIPSL